MIGTIGQPVTVTTPGTPVQVQSFAEQPSQHLSIHGVMFQALPTNTGIVYVGKSNMDGPNGINTLAFLAIPTANFIPTFSAALTIAPNGLVMQEFWIDAAEAGDGVIVTYLQT